MHFFQLGTHSAVTWRLFIFKFSQSLCYDSNFPPFPVTVHPTVSVSRVLLHRNETIQNRPHGLEHRLSIHPSTCSGNVCGSDTFEALGKAKQLLLKAFEVRTRGPESKHEASNSKLDA